MAKNLNEMSLDHLEELKMVVGAQYYSSINTSYGCFF
jgi:hypothetical protein